MQRHGEDADEPPAEGDVYLRQSRDFTGEERGISRQREDCMALLGRRGCSLGVEHVDNDVSAAGKRRRPGFEALLGRIETGQVRLVVAWNFDRLTRNARDRLRLLEAGRDRGLVIALARGSDLDLSTPGGRFSAGILGEVAQMEIDTKADRQRRAARQRSELGLPPLGVRLTGYTSQGELVPTEAETVRKIFQRFAAGDSLDSLARWLQETGVPTRHGGPWRDSSVRTILVNPRYAGRAMYDGKLTGRQGNWTPLVDEAVFDSIQAKLGDPRRRLQLGTDRKHLGSGLYLCGVCGGPVSGWTGHRYRCKQGCITRARPNIDEAVEASVREYLARPDLADLLPPDESPEVRRLAGEVTRLRSRLLTAESDYDSGLIDGRRYATATEKINAELTLTEVALASASRSQELAALRSGDPVAVYDAGSVTMRQAIIRALCVVRLYPAPRGRKTFDPATVTITYHGDRRSS